MALHSLLVGNFLPSRQQYDNHSAKLPYTINSVLTCMRKCHSLHLAPDMLAEVYLCINLLPETSNVRPDGTIYTATALQGTLSRSGVGLGIEVHMRLLQPNAHSAHNDLAQSACTTVQVEGPATNEAKLSEVVTAAHAAMDVGRHQDFTHTQNTDQHTKCQVCMRNCAMCELHFQEAHC